jgi:hypothetical protein
MAFVGNVWTPSLNKLPMIVTPGVTTAVLQLLRAPSYLAPLQLVAPISTRYWESERPSHSRRMFGGIRHALSSFSNGLPS